MRSVVAGIMCSTFTLAISQLSCGGEPAQFEPQPQQFRCRFTPIGGWNPYGGGLFHWWNPNCFPRPCGPDDYIRKPLPRVCYPARSPNHAPHAPVQVVR
jgi:hypothetical protein